MPRKLRSPMRPGSTRNELLEYQAFIMDRPSETMVPVPTEVNVGTSCCCCAPKFDPVCCSGASL